MILLLIKSAYSLIFLWSEFDSFVKYPSAFLFLLSVFNFFVSYLPSHPQHSQNFEYLKRHLLSWFIWSFVVIVAGGPISVASVALAALISSVSCEKGNNNSNSFFFFFKSFSTFAQISSLTSLLSFIKSPHFPAITALIGTLFAGLVNALDWAVPWQRFPIPNAFGCFIGELAGLLISFTFTFTSFNKF